VNVNNVKAAEETSSLATSSMTIRQHAGHWHCEKGISGTKMQSWKQQDMESVEKAEYAKPSMSKYWDFRHVIRYAFHPSRFHDFISLCVRR